MRYLLYARKSSESEDKQAQSIDDQLKELRALAAGRGLNVIAELTEARSAKAPGGRPVFAELVARIQAGEADAILCWHVNRLFRNPIDFGTVSWMLQTGALQEIHTPHQVHRSNDNVLLLSVESGMANQYILDLRKAVVRGLNSKVEKGWFPHKAPEGYRNVDGQIEPDPERFPLMRKAWEMMLSERYTPPQVLKVMTEEWGYTTRKHKRMGGTPLSRGSIYNIFDNIFYAGYFRRSGEVHQGSHPPMISLEEFHRVRKFIRKHHQVRPRTHELAYAGLMQCGQCGCAIVGDLKRKRLKDGTLKTYTYYGCSNAKRTCTRKVVAEEKLDEQLLNLLERIRIDLEFKNLGLQVIEEWREEDKRAQQEIQGSQAREVEALEKKRDKLLDLKLNDLLSDAEYMEEKRKVNEQLINLRMQQQQAQEQGAGVWDSVENAVALAIYGADFFEGGDPAMRAAIARTLGVSYILTNGRLAVEMNPALSPFCELKNRLEAGSTSPEEGDSTQMRLSWWDTLDVIRTLMLVNNVYIPSLLESVKGWNLK